MTTYTVMTPVGGFTATWAEDEDELVRYDGSPAGIAYLDSYIENMMLTRQGGYRLSLKTLEPVDLIDFCQSEDAGITVIPDAAGIRQEGEPMTMLDAVSAADEFAMIGEGAQILKRLDEDSDTFFTDLGRLREIVLLLGGDDSAPTPAAGPVISAPEGASDRVVKLMNEANDLYQRAVGLGLNPITPDQYMADIESGNRIGFSVASMKASLQEYKSMLVSVQTGTLPPRKVVGTGGTKKDAIEYLKKNIGEESAAIDAGGMANETNIRNYSSYLSVLIRTGKDETFTSNETLVAEAAARAKREAEMIAEAEAQAAKAAASRQYEVGSESGMRTPLTFVYSVNTAGGDHILAQLADIDTPQGKYDFLEGRIRADDRAVKRVDQPPFGRLVDFNGARRNGIQFGYFKIEPRKGFSKITLTIDVSGKVNGVTTPATATAPAIVGNPSLDVAKMSDEALKARRDAIDAYLIDANAKKKVVPNDILDERDLIGDEIQARSDALKNAGRQAEDNRWFEAKERADYYLRSMGYSRNGDVFSKNGFPNASIVPGSVGKGGFIVRNAEFTPDIEELIGKVAVAAKQTSERTAQLYREQVYKNGKAYADELLQRTLKTYSVPAAATQAEANGAIRAISPFLSSAQRGAIKVGMLGEESQFFRDKAVEMAKVIADMPKSYGQDGKGDAAVAYLHYFKGSADWYITEKDMSGDGTEQAFGYADLGQGGELGYISIAEIVSAGAELDLHWSPKTLGEIKGGNAAPADNNAPAPTVDRMDEAKKMVYTVAGEVDGTLSPWAESGNVGWQYSKMTITKDDKTTILNIGVSAGGVVQVDGNPFDPDKNVNDNIASVRKSVAAVLPKEPDMQTEKSMPSQGPLPWDGAPSTEETRWFGTTVRLTAIDRNEARRGLAREGEAELYNVINGGRALAVKWPGMQSSVRVSVDGHYVVEVVNLVDNNPSAVEPSPAVTEKPAPAVVPEIPADGPKTIEEAIASGAREVELNKIAINPAMSKKEREALRKSMVAGWLVGNGIRFPLRYESDVRMAEMLVSEKQDEEAFKPFDASKIRMPTAGQLNIKDNELMLLEGNPGWTNGNMLDISGKPQVVEKTLAASDVNKLRTIRQDTFDRIVNNAKAGATSLLAPTALYRQGKYPVVVLSNAKDEIAVMVNAFYYGYFVKSYKGAQFYGSGMSDPVVVKKGGVVIGVIMPMRSNNPQRLMRLGISPNQPAATAPEPMPATEPNPTPSPSLTEDTALIEAKTFLQTVVDGSADYWDAGLEAKLTALYEQYNGKDAAFDDLFNQAAEAYSNAMIQAAKGAMA